MHVSPSLGAAGPQGDPGPRWLSGRLSSRVLPEVIDVPPLSVGKGSDESKKRTDCHQCRGSSAAEQGPGGHERGPGRAR